ncbi:hypothetical protein [Actinospongicola halichondriae]|uniref:hypothetical protein n=1 Tax=Actinospongicola halichondriae TaxID=3236844 RepID=UPI003D41DF02
MTEFTIDDISKTLKDSLYVTIGLGVIAFQKAQVQRQELRKQVEGNLAGTRSLVSDSIKTVQERLEAVEGRIDTVLDDVEQQLPEQARSVMRQARDVAKDTRTQLVDLVERSVETADA